MNSPKPLPEDGKARLIFLDALRKYSANCSPPRLIETCPYAIPLGDGNRGCLEECVQLLDEHGMTLRGDAISLGSNGIMAERRALPLYPKNSGRQGCRPFDAAELFYCESEKAELNQWHTAALLYELKATICGSPSQRRLSAANIDRLLKEIARRGLPAAALISEGLRVDLVESICVTTALAALTRDGEEGPSAGDDASVRGWASIRDRYYLRFKPARKVRFEVKVEQHMTEDGTKTLPVENHEKMAFTLVGPFRDFVERWSMRAELSALVRWTPPVEDEAYSGLIRTDTTPRSISHGRAEREAVWIMDRFTKTYLEKWSPQSHALEWAYRRGQYAAPFSDEDGEVPPMDMAALATAVADHETSYDKQSQQLAIVSKELAKLLEAGYRDAAIALSGIYSSSELDNPEFQNNHGFCLLPSDPESALGALELAHTMGYVEPMNLPNRVLALYWMGNLRGALDVAEAEYSDWWRAGHSKAFLWSYGDGPANARLLKRACPTCYLRRLVMHIAEEAGDDELVSKWRERTNRRC